MEQSDKDTSLVMLTFTDLHILAELAGTRSKGSFAEFMERETGYTWDGTAEGKVSLMRMYEKESQDSHLRGNDENGGAHIEKLELALLPILADMEVTGVRLDVAKLRDIGVRIRRDVELLEKEIYEVTGEFFNINSPKQVADILFGKLAIKGGKKNKTGYSVDSEVLEEIAKEHAIGQLILDYRSLTKLQSTYVEALVKATNPDTHRVHTTYGQLGAATGRMNSNDPNLQNIPTGKGYAEEIKSCFIPSEGNVFVVADYSQIEIRVLAWLSQDENLLDAFEKGEDIHARTAKFLFGSSPSLQRGTSEGQGDLVSEKNPQPAAAPLQKELTEAEQRRIAKTVNFGVIYGITGFGLSKTLGTSSWEADAWIKAFYEKYPGVRKYYDGILEKGRELGYVETAFGRRRYIPGLRDANKTIRSISEREAINMPIQGTAADMIKYAMLSIDANIRDKNLTGKMLLQVHDELVFDVPKDEVSAFESLIRESMEGVISDYQSHIMYDIPRVPPIRADIHTGENWVEAKG